MNDSELIGKLLQLEAFADMLLKECYKTRKLVEKEANVSTPAKDQPALSREELAKLSARRRKRMLRNHK